MAFKARNNRDRNTRRVLDAWMAHDAAQNLVVYVMSGRAPGVDGLGDNF